MPASPPPAPVTTVPAAPGPAADLSALFLNCTLKPSPAPSNTQVLIDKVAGHFADLGTTSETVRVVDLHIPHGESLSEGDRDQFPLLMEKIRACDILLIATPVWLGERSSVAKKVAERLDATTYQLDDRNQHECYGKVGGAIATGEGDGGQNCVAQILYNLMIAGFTTPPNADCFYTGEAGPGGPYATHGTDHHYTNERARWMAHNLVHLARIVKANPYPTDLKALTDEATKESRPQPTVPPRV